MKALTLTQPWATLMAIGQKQIETRSWSTNYRGPTAIHAAKGFPDYARTLCHEIPFVGLLRRAGYSDEDQLPRGAIVAVADLRSVFRFDHRTETQIRTRSAHGTLPPFERELGSYDPGRFGFAFADMRPLTEPIAARGMLSLWEVPPDVLDQIREQTDEEHHATESAP